MKSRKMKNKIINKNRSITKYYFKITRTTCRKSRFPSMLENAKHLSTFESIVKKVTRLCYLKNQYEVHLFDLGKRMSLEILKIKNELK